MRERDPRGWLVGSKRVDTCEHHHCTCDGHNHEEEEETVRHAEDCEGKVIIIFDPVIEAAQTAEGQC